jgi:hypothetical protein
VTASDAAALRVCSEGPAADTISSLPTPFFKTVSRLLVQDIIDMLLELLAGFKISTESSTRAKQPGKARLILFHAPDLA